MNSPGGWLTDLSEEDCRDLLATCGLGRLVWNGAEGLSATPVNYTLDQGDLLIRLEPYSLAARECDGQEVAFEVDEIDATQRRGWSVLARGRAQREITGVAGRGASVDVWPAGVRPLVVRISIERLTGRRLETSSMGT